MTEQRPVDIRLYDTRTREKRLLVPIDPGRVTMYVCGPTVYNRAHIGNFRPEVVFDVLARLLRHRYGANAVVHARNITDIDDKIMDRARESGRSVEAVASEAAGWYFEDARALGVETLPEAPHATGHLATMIQMMQALIAKGHAYVAEGHVLFDVASDAGYGSLSRRPMDEMIAGARVEVAPYKKNPGDFVLWKPSTDDQPGWDSPWGRGRPGWHTECTAMIRSTLGETIDIHGGGQDLIFPHHENEAAQGRCVHDGAPLSQFWLHNGFLNFGDDKMSKSLGNIVTVPALLAAGHRGETIRLALLMAHYRQPLDWTESLLKEAKDKLDYFYGLLRQAMPAAAIFDPLADVDSDEAHRPLSLPFELALMDDLNTPRAISHLHELGSALANSLRHADFRTMDGLKLGLAGVNENRRDLLRAANLLGLLGANPDQWFTEGFDVDTETQITDRIAARTAAKAAKNWAEADRIRDELKADGIVLEDRPDGTTDWRRA